MAIQPHSADQFGAQRDFWWNRDFLDLMAAPEADGGYGQPWGIEDRLA